jgi:O-antigen/teichoic acid export membrane protein
MMINLSEAIRNGRSRAVLGLWHKTTLNLAMVFIPLLSLLLLTARELIVFLFTTDYLASVPIFMIWSTTTLLAVFQTDAVLRVYAVTRFLVFQNVLRIVLIVALISYFLSTFGLMGGVLITIIASIAAKSLALVRMCNLMNCRFRHLVPWRKLAVILALAILASIPAILMKWELRMAPLPALVTTTLLYASTYAFLLLHWGPLSNEGKLFVSRWLRNDAALRLGTQKCHIDRKEMEHNDTTRERRTVEGRGRVLHRSRG